MLYYGCDGIKKNLNVEENLLAKGVHIVYIWVN